MRSCRTSPAWKGQNRVPNVTDPPAKPYKGLKPFALGDEAIFYGRREDVRLIVANLYAAPVTILYGPTGVGKSSVLQAGVLPKLRDSAVPVYWNSWEGDWLKKLKQKLATWPSVAEGAIDDTETFDKVVQSLVKETDKLVVVILDQFEAYLDQAAQDFDNQLARAIRNPGVRASFLIGIREDCFVSLDRLKPLVPRLFGSTLRLDLLDRDCAGDAIREPLRLPQFAAEAREDLIEVFLGDRLRISPVELQIVFDEQWLVDCGRVPRELCLESYRGRQTMVEDFVKDKLSKTLGADSELGASVLKMLVPEKEVSLTRTLERLSRGIKTVKGHEEDVSKGVRRIVGALCEAGILRQNSKGCRVHHDVLQEPISVWCQDQPQSTVGTGSDGVYSRELENQIRRKDQDIYELREGLKKAENDARDAEAQAKAARALLFEQRDPEESVRMAIGALGRRKEAAMQAADALFRFVVQFGPTSEGALAESSGLRAEGRPDGRIDLYRALDTGSVEYWKTLSGLTEGIAGLGFSDDGARLAARGANSLVRIWDVRTGQEIGSDVVGKTPFSQAEIQRLYRGARSILGLPEPVVVHETPRAAEPEYVPFLAPELQEESDADASRE